MHTNFWYSSLEPLGACDIRIDYFFDVNKHLDVSLNDYDNNNLPYLIHQLSTEMFKTRIFFGILRKRFSIKISYYVFYVMIFHLKNYQQLFFLPTFLCEKDEHSAFFTIFFFRDGMEKKKKEKQVFPKINVY